VPYEEVIRRIEEAGGIVIDKEHAALDQSAGIAKAYELGYKNIAVTVAIPAEAKRLRKDYPDAVIFGVHVTGLDCEEAEMLVAASDFVTSCASAAIREVAGKKALLQAGVGVPTFAVTQKAKDLILEKIRCGKEQVVVRTTKLPAVSEQQPEPLV
jgi:putative methanogenesis marker protein 8